MAPKKPPDKTPAKDEPPPADKTPNAPGQLTPLQERVKKFFESSYSLYVGAVLVMGSIIAASLLTYLYVKEVERRALFKAGTKRIVQIIEESYPEIFDADDITKFQKAENVSLAISEEKKKIAEIQRAILDIQHKIRHEEWIVSNGAAYLFDYIASPRPWKQCIHYCKRMKYDTHLLCPVGDTEESFAASIVVQRPTDYHTGVHKTGENEWNCYQKEVILTKHYWASSEFPRHRTPPENCVILKRNCNDPSKVFCWHNAPCLHSKRCICKRNPVKSG